MWPYLPRFLREHGFRRKGEHKLRCPSCGMHRLREHGWEECELEESTKLQGALPVERAQAGKHKLRQHRFGEHGLRENSLRTTQATGERRLGSTCCREHRLR